MQWSNFFKKVESITDALVPYALIIILVIVIVEIMRPSIITEFPIIEEIDAAVVIIFFVDLCFKFYHANTIPEFFKKNWLEVLAIFPFFLFFRALEGLGLLRFAASDVIKEGQGLMHAGQAAEKELAVVAREGSMIEKEAAYLARVTRTERLARFIRPIFGLRRSVHAIHFFQHPNHRTKIKHH